MTQQVRIVLMAGIILLAGCATRREIEVTDLKYGLMKENKNGEWYVYKEAEKFPYVDNGVCTVTGERKSCMYFGHTFNYRLNSDVNEIECTVEFAKPINSVDIYQDHGTTSVISWKETINESGRVQNVGYSLKGNGMASTVICKHKNIIIFSYKRVVEGYAP